MRVERDEHLKSIQQKTVLFPLLMQIIFDQLRE